MLALKRFLEWYLGVPPAEPGEGTAWNFSARTPWPGWLPHWGVLLLAAALIAFVVWVYRRDASAVGWAKRLGLVALRLAAIGMMLVFLTELSVSVDRTGLPVVVLLIDDSASMESEDQFAGTDSENAIRNLLAAIGESRLTRLNLARSVLLKDDAAFLRELLRQHKLRVYRFSETAILTEGQTGDLMTVEDLKTLLPALAGLKATGDQTRPGPAVRKVLNDLRGTPPSAVIVMSDGITSTSDADRLTGIAEFARSKLVPIYTIGTGSDEPARDLELYDMLSDEVAFLNDPIPFSAKVRSYGFAGQEITVVLRQAGQKKVLASTKVRAPADGQAVKVELTYAPPEQGDIEFELEAEPMPRETNRENNVKSRRTSVREEKMRVLLADSSPRYEFRYLKALLERDKTIELHTVLQEADLDFATEDRTALDNFPVKREDLFRYDAVIFGDLNPGYLNEAVYENLRDFVRDAGGGVIFVAGSTYTPLVWRGTPIEVMLPVALGSAKAPPEDAPIVEGFRPELTIDGRRSSSVFRFAETEAESVEVWKNLPELFWLFEAPELKPGAVAFAERASRGINSPRLPVIALQRFGGGKVLFHATDDLWRWRFRVGDVYYGRYWIQAIRYLSRSRLLGKDRGAELDSDRQDYQRGDTVHLRVRFFEDRLAPTENDGVTVMVERRGDAQKPVKLNRLPQTPNVFEGQLSNTAEGSYHAWVVTPAFRDAPPAHDFRVEATDRERQKRGLDRVELEQTAKRTHGKYYPITRASELLADLPPGQPVPLESQEPIQLWNRWELLLLFTLVLSGEWMLRKRLRLV